MAMDDSRRAFLAMVSHELRTPLNAIIGFSEIISRELYGPLSEPRYREHAVMIHEGGMRLLKLINEILDIARLEAGVMDLDVRPEHPLAAAEEVMRSLASEAAKRNVRLQLTAPAETPAVLADSRGLHTILQTLLQNAIAFSPEGGTIEIGAHGEDEWVVFEIVDHGQEVSPADLARMLNPFDQAGGGFARRAQGAGLSFAIAELLCRTMGGKLAARSNPGEGLTAIVRLPAERSA